MKNYIVHQSQTIIDNQELMIRDLLISRENFKRHFPDKDSTWGYHYYNIFVTTAPSPVFYELYKELNKVLEEYKKKFTYCHINQAKWGLTEGWTLQRYKPKEGYFYRHCERTGGITLRRHLAFMTYLNTVKDGGQTEFVYQKLRVRPEIGLTLIWGSDWPFTHRGITSPTETKYIATGLYSYEG